MGYRRLRLSTRKRMVNDMPSFVSILLGLLLHDLIKWFIKMGIEDLRDDINKRDGGN